MGGKDSGRDVAKWLESPEGQKWSHDHHDGPRRGSDLKTGAFGELKTDYESCVWTGTCQDHGGSR